MKPGDRLGPIERAPDAVDLFLYSAAVWVPHRIHYDLEHARAEGHAGLVVPGPLQAAYLARLADDFARGRGGRLRSMSVRHVGTAVAGTPLRCAGEVVEVAGGRATCELWVERAAGGERTTEGTAVLELSGQAPLR